jgi:hypothetical protein
MKKIIYLFLVVAIVSPGCNYLKKKGLLGKKRQMQEYIKQLEEAKKDDSAYYSSQLQQLKNESQARIDSLQSACDASYTYYIVTGSFRNPSNAQAYANKMLDLGYKAEIILAPNGFNMVSAFGCNTMKEAVNALTSLKTNVAEDTWMYVAAK